MTHDIHAQRILILDFGSQYTQLIARRVREIGVFSEIRAWDMSEAEIRAYKPSGIILAGSPESTTEKNSPRAPQIVFDLGVPVLGMRRKSWRIGSRISIVRESRWMSRSRCIMAEWRLSIDSVAILSRAYR